MTVNGPPTEHHPISKSGADVSVVTRVGLDLAKHVFQVHAVDSDGKVIVAKALHRRDVLPFFAAQPPCLVGMEASGSAHHWGRELIAPGHDVKLIPPACVKPFVTRQKNDANDAAAIHETLPRPGLRFVKVRSIANQAMLMQHEARAMLVAQRTELFICRAPPLKNSKMGAEKPLSARYRAVRGLAVGQALRQCYPPKKPRDDKCSNDC